MKLIERIDADFMAAFKAKEMNKKNFLGVIRGEVQTQKGKGIEPTDANVLKVLKKMEKSLKETGDAKGELEYLTPYLPKMMSKAEIAQAVQEIVENGASNMGMVMKEFNNQYAGLADMKEVNLAAQILL